jgi:hypothetical protein
LIVGKGLMDSEVKLGNKHVAKTIFTVGFVAFIGVIATASLSVTVPVGAVGGSICILFGAADAGYQSIVDLINYATKDINPQQTPDIEEITSSHDMIKNKLEEKKGSSCEKYATATKNYLEHFNNKELNSKKIAQLYLTDNEWRLFGKYFDPITNNVINIPVLLDDQAFDLDTLLKAFDDNQLNPLTNVKFTLSDITPHEKMETEIDLLIRKLSKSRQKKMKSTTSPEDLNNEIELAKLNVI